MALFLALDKINNKKSKYKKKKILTICFLRKVCHGKAKKTFFSVI
jgi:hypothetical protein